MGTGQAAGSALRQSILLQLRVLLWSGLFFGPALRIEALGVRRVLTPELWVVQELLIAATGLTLLAWFYLLAVKIRPLWGEFGRRRWLYFSGSVLAHAVVALGAGVTLLMVGFELFVPQYLGESKPSPDGRKVAYLYSRGFGCGYTLFVRSRWDWALTEAHKVDRDCDTIEAATIAWSADGGRVWLLNPRGGLMEGKAMPPPWH